VRVFTSINPHTGEEFSSYPAMSAEEASSGLLRAVKAQSLWSKRSFSDRAEVLFRVADLLEAEADALGHLMALEMGKVRKEGFGESKKCAWVTRYYAENAQSMLATKPVNTDASRSLVRYDPLGVVLAIMPWNFPLWQVMRFVAPALMAGNGIFIKHAPNTMGCSVAIADLLVRAGVPEDLVQHTPLAVKDVESVIANPAVAAVTFTGSTAGGRKVAEICGRYGKPSVLELGGSDPFIVLEDANLEAAADAAVASRLLNAGQSCIAAKRIIVCAAVADDFLACLRLRLDALVVGDPCDENVTVGPMARADLRSQLHEQVVASVSAGATLEMGGEIPAGSGFHYPVTLLTNVASPAPAWDDELFGPVVAVRVVKDQEEAILAANDTPFGLGAAVFTQDLSAVDSLASQIQAGCLFVNGMVKSDPRLPFGGVKASGYGRELGAAGIMQFVNVKTVWVA
jgi:succinate-semialdehyde dehydrogenase/glutarate-semialdehyde dehydrogenase